MADRQDRSLTARPFDDSLPPANNALWGAACFPFIVTNCRRREINENPLCTQKYPAPYKNRGLIIVRCYAREHGKTKIGRISRRPPCPAHVAGVWDLRFGRRPAAHLDISATRRRCSGSRRIVRAPQQQMLSVSLVGDRRRYPRGGSSHWYRTYPLVTSKHLTN